MTLKLGKTLPLPLDAITQTFGVLAMRGAGKISFHTARNHLKHAFRKLGVHSQVELVAKFGGGHG